MCGIAGSLDLGGGDAPAGEALALRMTAALAHRGPDGQGLYVSGGVALGHTRLSLIDLAGGKQPMSGESGDVVVSFNGEIYNFAALREELAASGHRFRTRSDTEVIPRAYEQWGDAAVERLQGMFAFALWDGRKRRLLLARDRIGIKPLYYALVGDRLLFASEIKALLACAELPRRLDPEALHDYLSLQVSLAPRTLLRDVRALEPGTVLAIEDGRMLARRYWQPRITPDDALDERRALEGLEERLHAVLRDQVVADVPVGAFLSGGIDSSLLAAFLVERRSAPLDTFTVGWSGHDADETPEARRIAERLGTRHHELRVARDAAGPELVRAVMDQFDQPFGDSSAIPTWLVSRETRRFVKTVISGDGGDELFGGHINYRVADRLSQLRRLPAPARTALGGAAHLLRVAGQAEGSRQLRKALGIAGLSAAEALCALRSYFDEGAKAELYRPGFLRDLGGYRTAAWFADAAAEHRDLATALAAYDLRHRLGSDMLQKVDVMSMSHGLEVRVPLLDERIVELALRLPANLRLRRGVTKYLLRRAARRHLPEAVAGRPKTGFVIPLGHAAGGALSTILDETVCRERPRLGAIFRPEVLRSLAAAFRGEGPAPEGVSRWQVEQRVYILAALERFLERWNVEV